LVEHSLWEREVAGSNPVIPIYFKLTMQKFTIKEFQSDFDNLLERVENGESFIIADEEKEVVIMPANDYKYIVDGLEEHDDLIRIHTDHEEGC